MLTQSEMTHKLQAAFEPNQAEVLAEVIPRASEDLVKTSDFNDLKSIVKDLAVAQQDLTQDVKTLSQEVKTLSKEMQKLTVAQQDTAKDVQTLSKEMQKLTVAQQEIAKDVQKLTVAQQDTAKDVQKLTVAQQEIAKDVQKLTVAQQDTAKDVQKLTVAQQDTAKDVQKLSVDLRNVRSEVGGISRSMSYALENEAYRSLPTFLLNQFGIEITDRLIRTDVGGEEINFFGHAVRDGEPMLIVGESKQRLDERRSSYQEEERILSVLARKAESVRAIYPDTNIVLLLITHYARPSFLKTAEAQDIIVVQSFEW